MPVRTAVANIAVDHIVAAPIVLAVVDRIAVDYKEVVDSHSAGMADQYTGYLAAGFRKVVGHRAVVDHKAILQGVVVAVGSVRYTSMSTSQCL